MSKAAFNLLPCYISLPSQGCITNLETQVRAYQRTFYELSSLSESSTDPDARESAQVNFLNLMINRAVTAINDWRHLQKLEASRIADELRTALGLTPDLARYEVVLDQMGGAQLEWEYLGDSATEHPVDGSDLNARLKALQMYLSQQLSSITPALSQPQR